jgi:hypothetical protein
VFSYIAVQHSLQREECLRRLQAIAGRRGEEGGGIETTLVQNERGILTLKDSVSSYIDAMLGSILACLQLWISPAAMLFILPRPVA